MTAFLDRFSDTELNEWLERMTGTCVLCSKPFLKTHIHQKFCQAGCLLKYHKRNSAAKRKEKLKALEGEVK